MKMVLLGGYGAVGYETVKILLNRRDADIVIAGRSLKKAKSAAVKLSRKTNTTRISGRSIDAFNYSALVAEYKTAA